MMRNLYLKCHNICLTIIWGILFKHWSNQEAAKINVTKMFMFQPHFIRWRVDVSLSLIQYVQYTCTKEPVQPSINCSTQESIIDVLYSCCIHIVYLYDIPYSVNKPCTCTAVGAAIVTVRCRVRPACVQFRVGALNAHVLFNAYQHLITQSDYACVYQWHD